MFLCWRKWIKWKFKILWCLRIINFKFFKCILVHCISHLNTCWFRKFIQIFVGYLCGNIWVMIYQRHQLRYFSNNWRSSRSIILLHKIRMSTSFKIEIRSWHRIKSLFRIRIISQIIWNNKVFRLIQNRIIFVIRLPRIFKTRRISIGWFLDWFILAKRINIWKHFSFRLLLSLGCLFCGKIFYEILFLF